MNVPVYIESVGLSCENFAGLSALRTRDAAQAPPRPAQLAGSFDQARVRLRPEIDREDRSILNTVSTLVVNAVDDAVAGLPEGQPLAAFAQAPVFIGSDEAEHNFGALHSVVGDESGEGSVYARLAGLSQRVNPLELLRQLSTNPAYHASKRLRAQGGAYPLRAASLSGLVAAEEAISWLAEGRGETAAVVAGCNMRSFDALLSFSKLGILKGRSEGAGVVVSYGAACLLLSRRAQAARTALGAILAARSYFMPEAHGDHGTWEKMYRQAVQDWGRPDVVVRYSIGASAIDKAERDALEAVLPGTPTRCYKPLFGYTGKANNLLDLAAALTDETIAPASRILIAGVGMGYGIGCLLVEKGGAAHE